jgi:hypothetical protein
MHLSGQFIDQQLMKFPLLIRASLWLGIYPVVTSLTHAHPDHGDELTSEHLVATQTERLRVRWQTIPQLKLLAEIQTAGPPTCQW